MRSISDRLDRFCYNHPKLCIPNLMLYIVMGTAAVYLLDMFSMGGVSFSSLLTFNPYLILHGQVWRLVTFLIVPGGGNVLTTFISLYFYYFVGSSLEREWGSVKFTVFYGLGTILYIIFGVIYYALAFSSLPVDYLPYLSMFDGTFLNLSLFFAFATLYPDLRILLFFILPVKVKWLAWLDAALFFWSVFSALVLLRSPLLALVPIVAVLNYVLFFWSDLIAIAKRMLHRFQHQTSHQTVNFKKATREAKKEKGYLHKCAVCGVTDADDPTMEFRYCSKCNGYYCYCMNHINNHVHIQ